MCCTCNNRTASIWISGINLLILLIATIFVYANFSAAPGGFYGQGLFAGWLVYTLLSTLLFIIGMVSFVKRSSNLAAFFRNAYVVDLLYFFSISVYTIVHLLDHIPSAIQVQCELVTSFAQGQTPTAGAPLNDCQQVKRQYMTFGWVALVSSIVLLMLHVWYLRVFHAFVREEQERKKAADQVAIKA